MPLMELTPSYNPFGWMAWTAMAWFMLGILFHLANLLIGPNRRKRTQELMDDTWLYLDEYSYEILIRKIIARLIQRIYALPRKTLCWILAAFVFYVFNAAIATSLSSGDFFPVFGRYAWGYFSLITALNTIYSVFSLFVTITLLRVVMRSSGWASLCMVLAADVIVAAFGFVWVAGSISLYQDTLYPWLVNRALQDNGLSGTFTYDGFALFRATFEDIWTGRVFTDYPATGGLDVVSVVVSLGLPSVFPTLAHLGLAMVVAILIAAPGWVRKGINQTVYLCGTSEVSRLFKRLGYVCFGVAGFIPILRDVL